MFYVGGVTYTEAKEADVYEDAKVIVGGSFVHNSKTFIGEVIQLKSLNEVLNEWIFMMYCLFRYHVFIHQS